MLTHASPLVTAVVLSLIPSGAIDPLLHFAAFGHRNFQNVAVNNKCLTLMREGISLRAPTLPEDLNGQYEIMWKRLYLDFEFAVTFDIPPKDDPFRYSARIAQVAS